MAGNLARIDSPEIPGADVRRFSRLLRETIDFCSILLFSLILLFMAAFTKIDVSEKNIADLGF